MAEIKAIETAYKGYRFRSRLEARWAVFFDALGIEWQYEFQGFEKVHEGITYRYLPDFFLPATKTWVEVKGGDDALARDRKTIETILDHPCALPEFTDDDVNWWERRGLLILGDIPDPDQWGIQLHTILCPGDFFPERLWAYFRPPREGLGYLEIASPQTSLLLGDIVGRVGLHHIEADWTTRSIFVPAKLSHSQVHSAYRAARSARFEHGEKPKL